MKHIHLCLVLCLAMAAQAKNYNFRTVPNDPMHARIYQLENGLTVYMTRNTEKPEIKAMVAVRAGSQNDPLNATGLAHYQEHLMFKGTTQYGTTDYAKEKPILDAIDELYEVYGQTTDPEKRKAIYHQIDSFSYEGSKIAIANEFDKLMSSIGATGVNAYTSGDRTCYFEVIPAGELRRWAMIESGRFTDLVVRGFHTELEAVYEEFNMYSTMDQQKILLAIDQTLYPNIPYRQHTTLGTQEHLKNPSLKEIKKFYNTYYRPNNVAVILSGDFDFNKAIAIVDEYFGSWQPQYIPAADKPQQEPLAVHKDTVVYGNESPQLWMAYRFPAVTDKDMDIIEVMSEVLQNGKCGLFDLDIAQKQLLLGAESGLVNGNDFSTYYLIGVPKDGQSLDDVRNIMLAEVEKLKKGDFSEDMLAAIVANLRRHKMEALQSNDARVNIFLNSFIYGIPYEETTTELDRKAKVTKADIVRVANQYFTDTYACVKKEQGENVNPAKVEKPQITPIEMNREAKSQFFARLEKMHAEPLTPQFLDFDKDLSRKTLAHDQMMYYVQNKDNQLFSLDMVVERGTNDLPELDLATDLMAYLGTATLSAEELQAELYRLAAETSVYNSGTETHFMIYGLQENFDATLRLLEDHVLGAQADETIYKELVADRIKAHNDAKSDQKACFGNLSSMGKYGKAVHKRLILTPKQMRKLSGAIVLDELRGLVPGISRVEYYGPATEQEITARLNSNSRLLAQGEKSKQLKANRLRPEEIQKSEVWMAPYNANNIYLMGLANWGEKYDVKSEAVIRLFNEYFGGSMGSIVFQEMREARALCYTAYAGYSQAGYEGENNTFQTYIITQNDKLQAAMDMFDSICDNLPISATAFEQAKSSLLKNIEKRRYVRSSPISSYLAFTRKGWDHDCYREIYEAVKNLTMDDVVAFQKEHVAHRTYRYLVLGNKKELDMKYLKRRGKVRQFREKDIFVY